MGKFTDFFKKLRGNEEFDIKKHIQHLHENKKKIPVIFYFEGLPICEKVRIKEILENEKTIILEPEKKLLKALGEVKSIFLKVQHGNKTLFFRSNVIYGNKDGVEVDFPKPLIREEVVRLHLRVKPKWNEPVLVDIFPKEDEDKKNEKSEKREEKKEEKKVYLRGKIIDISETEIKVFVPFKSEIENDCDKKNFYENLKEEKIVKLKIYLPKMDTVDVTGEITECKKEKKGKVLEISFLDIDIENGEKIFRYIFRRQKEILKYLTSEEEL